MEKMERNYVRVELKKQKGGVKNKGAVSRAAV